MDPQRRRIVDELANGLVRYQAEVVAAAIARSAMVKAGRLKANQKWKRKRNTE